MTWRMRYRRSNTSKVWLIAVYPSFRRAAIDAKSVWEAWGTKPHLTTHYRSWRHDT